MKDACATIADQLGLLLQRRVRRDLTDEVIDGVHPDIDSGAYTVLSGVARYGSVSAAALGAEIGVDRALVSRRAARLSDAGLLRIAADPRDRRAHSLRLSPKGAKVVDVLRARLVAAIDRRLSAWTPGERQQFADQLTLFVASMSDEPSAAPDVGGRSPGTAGPESVPAGSSRGPATTRPTRQRASR